MFQRKISRKEFLKLVTLGSGAAILVACAPAATQPVETAEQVNSDATQAEATATVAPTEEDVPVATDVPAAAEKTISLWLSPYQPTEWTERSAEHPTVVNATRVLAEQFQQEFPNVKFDWVEVTSEGEADQWAAWLTARIAAGDAPDLIWSLHNISVQNGWTLPIESYLDQPNPYAPSYAKWRDIFYPSLMTSLIWQDGHEYCAPIRAIWPYLEVGLIYNKEVFEKEGLKAPSTWSEEKEVSKYLKEKGLGGLSPWPSENDSGNCWPLALQILPPMMQSLCKEMDLNGDMFVGADEALPAFKKGLIGPKTALYRRAWSEMYALAQTWVDGFNTTDLDQLYRQGKTALQYRATWEFSQMAYDPTIPFEQGFLPAPMPNSEDLPFDADEVGAYDPPMMTAGDGSVPGDLITAVQGPDLVILKDAVKAHGNLDETIRWWQYMTTPENNAYIVNENQNYIPSAVDASLGSIWNDIAGFKLPLYDYSIAWWGMGLYWDAQNFQNWRKLFVSWVTGQFDEATFFDRQQTEFEEGASRYEQTLSTTD